MEAKTKKHTNRLAKESSPYLLQHAHNPVDWYPWSNAALQRAKDEDKLILISVGYSACHWCHVMEHESFEDEAIAKLMNENFVCIKVDREERPDIDQVYMDAVNIMTGSGGWPLNCFALPDGRPVFGGTYFQKGQWKNILKQLATGYFNEKERFTKAAEELGTRLQGADLIRVQEEFENVTQEDIESIYQNYQSRFDSEDGGYKGSPKFPMPNLWEFVLNYAFYTKNKEALNQLELTLTKLAQSGTYDQLGGGFARYATDRIWKVPHFEKMLYDNAQLVSLYSYAYQHTKNPLYKNIVYETLDFIERDMMSPEGGFYSAYDADSEGVEGKFYVWKESEIRDILDDALGLFLEHYGITKEGNWESGNNILHIVKTIPELAKTYYLDEHNLERQISLAKRKLFKEREKRIKPGLDDKILASWNALMLKAYADAYIVFKDERFKQLAIRNADFLLTNMITEGNQMFRSHKNGKASINAFLDDYTFTIEAFIKLYQATFDEQYIQKAKDLLEYVQVHFYNEESKMYFYTSNLDDPLVSRKTETTDNVIPSSNSSMARNLFILGHYFYNDEYIEQAKQMLANMKDMLLKHGSYFSNWGLLALHFAYQPYEVAILGENCQSFSNDLQEEYRPDIFLAGSKESSALPLLKDRFMDGQTRIYVCKDRTCQSPVTSVDYAKEHLIR